MNTKKIVKKLFLLLSVIVIGIIAICIIVIHIEYGNVWEVIRDAWKNA